MEVLANVVNLKCVSPAMINRCMHVVHTLISIPAGILSIACYQGRIEHSKSRWSIVMVGSW